MVDYKHIMGEPLSRREMLMTTGGVIAFFLSGSYAMGRFNLQQRMRTVGKDITLKVGESYELPGENFRNLIYYSGMFDNQRFIMTQLVQRYDVGASPVPHYFPSTAENIKFDNHKFSVRRVTPEEIMLKYLGV